ncbi:FAS1 domain-containing protein [Paraphysoderma sedebokerense]|nr:FAS1 domain-containing protein [Paraphysoderma sedebokerense]
MKIFVFAVLLAFTTVQINAQNENSPVLDNLNTIGANPNPLPGKTYTLRTLTGLVTQNAAIRDAISNSQSLTLFAPTDAAFTAAMANNSVDQAKIPDVLSYHVVPFAYTPMMQSYQILPTLLRAPSQLVNLQNGSQVISVTAAQNGVIVDYGVDSTTVIDTIRSRNGVIHVVEKVLLPPPSLGANQPYPIMNGYGNTIRTNAAKANLVQPLTTTPGITVFAPIDSSFASIQAQVDQMSVDQLSNILRYHVIPSVVYFNNVTTTGMDAATLQGEQLNVKNENGKVRVNNLVNVVHGDVLLSNGVLHFIDGVLMPKNVNAQPGAGTPVQGNNPGAGASPVTENPTPVSSSNKLRHDFTHLAAAVLAGLGWLAVM